jgi:hypothetical protein
VVPGAAVDAGPVVVVGFGPGGPVVDVDRGRVVVDLAGFAVDVVVLSGSTVVLSDAGRAVVDVVA